MLGLSRGHVVGTDRPLESGSRALLALQLSTLSNIRLTAAHTLREHRSQAPVQVTTNEAEYPCRCKARTAQLTSLKISYFCIQIVPRIL